MTIKNLKVIQNANKIWKFKERLPKFVLIVSFNWLCRPRGNLIFRQFLARTDRLEQTNIFSINGEKDEIISRLLDWKWISPTSHNRQNKTMPIRTIFFVEFAPNLYRHFHIVLLLRTKRRLILSHLTRKIIKVIK